MVNVWANLHGIRGMTRRQLLANLEKIISWDRDFEQIGGLQNMEHKEAKSYLRMYVGIPADIDQYTSILKSIKDDNSKQLGKLARQVEKRYPPLEYQESKEALKILKALCPREESHDVEVSFRVDVARLHIPDFLPKVLWEHGIEIVEKYHEI